VWTSESGYFLSCDAKSVSSLSPNNNPIWQHNVEDEQSKFPATISLYGACTEDILVQRNLGYYSESGYHRIRVDGEIFESGKKSCGFKNIRIRVDGALDAACFCPNKNVLRTPVLRHIDLV